MSCTMGYIYIYDQELGMVRCIDRYIYIYILLSMQVIGRGVYVCGMVRGGLC